MNAQPLLDLPLPSHVAHAFGFVAIGASNLGDAMFDQLHVAALGTRTPHKTL